MQSTSIAENVNLKKILARYLKLFFFLVLETRPQHFIYATVLLPSYTSNPTLLLNAHAQ